MRNEFIIGSTVILIGVYCFSYVYPNVTLMYYFFGPIILLGIYDLFQKKHAILRNFPVFGHFRYWLEMIRPEIQQYFIESYEEGKPFSREMRSVIYQRAKGALDTLPFGSQRDMYRPGYEWINHSMCPAEVLKEDPRVLIGGSQCLKPYSASIFNISPMSFGALSKNAILALNKGAKLGGFAHNTGEGGISSYHQAYKADVIWQIGTGYFGCRTALGDFAPEMFREKASQEEIKMIEIKISQGAKPGHGGILPGVKVTDEIAEIRGVDAGKTVFSPPAHRAFTTPIELMLFVAKLRELSGGKPIGFKLCVGKRREFLSVIKAMLETDILPDYIAIDGAEGGTGAAPLEFSNSIGTPLNDGLIFAHNCLVGAGLRNKIKIIATGKVTTGFNIASNLALGADLCSSARGMMFAIGCIQALRCNSNLCPAGVATQNPALVKGLDPEDKGTRVYKYHKATVHSFLEVLSASGLKHPDDLRPWHIQRRESISKVRHYGQLYHYLEEGSLLTGEVPKDYSFAWKNSTPNSF